MSNYDELDHYIGTEQAAQRLAQAAQGRSGPDEYGFDNVNYTHQGNVPAAPGQGRSCAYVVIGLVMVVLVTWCVVGWFVQ